MDITHLHLHVRDRALSQAFYRRWFGLRATCRDEGITFMQGDRGFLLALAEDATRAPMPSWFHFGVLLDSDQQVKAMLADMQADGVTIVKPLYEDEAFASFRCADPDGHPVEVYWERR